MVNNMKKVFVTMMAVISLSGCSQEKKGSANRKIEKMNIDNYIPAESKNINRNNYVEKVLQSIKHYDREPIYYYRINKQNCLIEIDINDIRDYKDFELSNVITPHEIGHILRAGQQTVTVKMYPLGDLINKDLGLENQPPATKLSDMAKVDISVVMMDNKSAKGFDDEKIIVEKVSPKEAAGKEYYEFSFTFDAKVPYEFEGWTKGQDLRKLDQDLVRKKALEYYEMAGNIILQKDLDNWLKINYPLEKRIEGMYYADKEYLDDLVGEFKTELTTRDYRAQPMKDYKLRFMGDGKLLRLITTDQHPRLRGGGALLLNYGKKGVYQPGITLYLPEGRDLATQGFMMWK